MPTRKSSCNCGKLSVTYEGPDPERISLCQCYECQKRTGTVMSAQTRLPRENVTIEGPSSTWTFPNDSGEPATFRSCDSGGATYHFCPECGSTVYWDISIAPDVVGVGVGGFRPNVPAPDDLRLRGVRRCVGDERLGPSDASLRLRRNVTRRGASLTSRPQLADCS